MITNVYLTVDTELSMGGAWSNSALRPVSAERRIFCRIDGKDHGIGWLCDELDRYKFRATFFAEVFGSLIFGKDDTKAWCQYLLERGQDVQLHTHLNFYYYAEQQRTARAVPKHTDDLASLGSPERAELLDKACDLFRFSTGYHPLAFRAGNWRATSDLAADIQAAGIRLDSSFNPAARRGGSFAGANLRPNSLQKIGRLWELPLTVTKQILPEPHLTDGLRPFDLVSLSSWEIRKILNDANDARQRHVVAVLHSFSAVKARDSQYRHMRANHIVRARVRNMLKHLAANPDRFQVRTCADLVRDLDHLSADENYSLPNLGFVHPFARKLVQAANSLYWL